MSTMNETAAGPITRRQWREVLARSVAAELEPMLRRQFRRYAVRGEARATWLHDGTTFSRTWSILDISVQGMMVKAYEDVPTDVRLNLMVNLDGTPMPMVGRAIHCTQTLGGWKLGVELVFAAED